MNDRKLADLVTATEILLAPGVFDALGARIAEQAGAKALYLSGASIAYTRFGSPDIGLISMAEVADTLGIIGERTPLPIIADADTGFGNALNVQRTVRLFERNGAAGIQLEDQDFPKRCGHLEGKTLIPAREMIGKIKAAVDARRSEDTLIVARTDAIAVEGFESALERAAAYAEAGADVLFPEAPQDVGQMRRLNEELKDAAPLLANMVEGGKTPIHTAPELQEMGYSVVIFPSGLARLASRQTQEYMASLLAHGSNKPFMDRVHEFNSIQQIVGTAEMLRKGEEYKGE